MWLLTVCIGADVWNFKCKTSTETWIRTAKCSQKIPICSEDMHKIETQFLQSGIFPQSAMHTLSPFYIVTNQICNNSIKYKW